MFICIEDEPIFEAYKMVIDYAFKVSKSFLLHIPEDLSVDNSAEELLEEMKDHLMDILPSYGFTHTEYGERGEIYLYKCNDYTREIIKNKVTGLYDWRLPRLPEDLSFIDEDDKIWFWTISHESMGGIINNNSVDMDYINNMIEIKSYR